MTQLPPSYAGPYHDSVSEVPVILVAAGCPAGGLGLSAGKDVIIVLSNANSSYLKTYVVWCNVSLFVVYHF